MCILREPPGESPLYRAVRAKVKAPLRFTDLSCLAPTFAADTSLKVRKTGRKCLLAVPAPENQPPIGGQLADAGHGNALRVAEQVAKAAPLPRGDCKEQL